MATFSDTFYKQLFVVSALFNWIITTAWFFWYPSMFPLLGIAVPEDPMWLHLFLALAFVYGIGYYKVSTMIGGGQDIVLLGVIGKVMVFLLFFYYWLAGSGSLLLTLVGVGDLIFATLFVIYLRQQSLASREPVAAT